MPIQIKVSSSISDTVITVFNNTQVQDFNLTVANEPTSITFDPGNWILKTVNSIVVGVDDEVVLNEYSLEQNYPNPFNPNTTISFNLAKSGLTTLKIYDAIGNQITILVDGNLEAGWHKIDFDASKLTSGIYFYTLNSGSFTETKKMTLLK